MWRRIGGALLTCAAAAALAGCAAATPEITGSWSGLRTLVSADAPEDPARLFIIHGMTAQKDDYADVLVKALETRLRLADNGAAPVDQPYAVSGAIAYGDDQAYVNLRTYRLYDGRGERLRVSALNWSRLTESIKNRQFERDDQIPRARVNGDVKVHVVNDGVGDAALYLGKYQAVMRRGVMIGLCAFLEGTFENDGCAPTARSNAPVTLISESLGSYMLLDAIEALNAKANSAAGKPLFARLREFYMFANQVPLLELADLNPGASRQPLSAEASSRSQRLDAFIERARKFRTADQNEPLQIVAFTDPNDLLSYRLSRYLLANDGAPASSYRAANALYPVAQTYFGFFADPLKAHTGYAGDAGVLDLVICGSNGCA